LLCGCLGPGWRPHHGPTGAQRITLEGRLCMEWLMAFILAAICLVISYVLKANK
jgi:hypothetical protein